MPTAPRRKSTATVEEVVERAFHPAAAVKGPSAAIPAALFAERTKRARKRVRNALKARRKRTVASKLELEVSELVRRWAERDFRDGFEEIERLELRCFEDGEIAKARRAGDEGRVFAALEKKYRAAVLDEHGRIEIRGLQMSARVSQSLELVFVPLYIQDAVEVLQPSGSAKRGAIHLIPRVSAEEFVEKHARAILVGAPGSGKSTLVAWLAVQAANGRLGGAASSSSALVPFVLPIRSLQRLEIDERTIVDAVRAADAAFVRHVLAEKRALVIIDGLDEARGGVESLVPSLRAFAEAHPGNRILATTRPPASGGLDRLDVPGFTTTELQAMTREEVYTFIDRWCLAAEVSIQNDRARAEEDARRAAEDLKSRVQTSRPVERLAQTPLMCSVLCIVHRFLGQKIPERRAALYEACTNVLLYEWDRAKFPKGSTVGELDAQHKRFLLSGIARWMHERHKAEIAESDVVAQLSARLPSVNRSPDDAKAIVREIQERSGLLVERRPGFYAFSHLTFQEYLTAVDFVQSGHLKKLPARYADRWWHEVIALAAGLPGADAAELIRHLLEKVDAKSSTASMLAAHCVETAIDLPLSLRTEVEQGLRRWVPPRDARAARELRNLGDVAGPVLLRALDERDVRGWQWTTLALVEMGYEGAAGALARAVANTAQLDLDKSQGRRLDDNSSILINFDDLCRVHLGEASTVSDLAVFGLTRLALLSPVARTTLKQALDRATPIALSLFVFLGDEAIQNSRNSDLAILANELLPLIKARLQETQPAKRAARSG